MKKLISWNVNGLRAVMSRKDIYEKTDFLECKWA